MAAPYRCESAPVPGDAELVVDIAQRRRDRLLAAVRREPVVVCSRSARVVSRDCGQDQAEGE